MFIEQKHEITNEYFLLREIVQVTFSQGIEYSEQVS
jgi:hypothetical protein